MAERRTGLHKKVWEIFDGVPLQRKNGAQQPPDAPTPASAGEDGHPKRDERRLESPASAKPPAPSHLTATTPKPQQPERPSQEAAAVKQAKADTKIKTTKQIRWQETWQRIQKKLFTAKPGVNVIRQKAMVILVPVLFITFIFVLTQVFKSPSGKTNSTNDFVPSRAIAGTATNEIDWQIPEPYPTTLRDPMQFGSVTGASGETGTLIVKGIVYSGRNSSAVIGSQIAREGDEISGATVVKINKDSVEFEMNGKRWTQKVQR